MAGAQMYKDFMKFKDDVLDIAEAN